MASPRDAHTGNLLVVDDNRVNRLLLGRLLEQLGHTVTFAENGRGALEALRQRRVDLVLLDIEMPEMDGYQTLEALAALARELEAMARVGSFQGAADRIESLVAGYEAAARALGELRRDLLA